MYYNVYRWYQPAIGRYSRTDPLGTEVLEDADDTFANLFIYGLLNPELWEDPSGSVTLAPYANVPNWCRRRFERKIIPGLVRLLSKRPCRDFFCSELNSNLEFLLRGISPLIEIHGTPTTRGGHFDCTASPLTISIGRASLCHSTKREARQVVLHELAHYADCVFNRDRFPKTPLLLEEGCRAEVECFGKSGGDNCRRLGYTFRQF